MGNPIALVKSKNTGRGSLLSEENFSSLASSMHIYVGAKVVLTKNYLQVGLSNNSTRIVRELFYNTSKPTPSLPKFILLTLVQSMWVTQFLLTMIQIKVSFLCILC